MSLKEKSGPFKYKLLLDWTLKCPNEINDKNPISELINNFKDIKSIINGNTPNIFKFIYFNKNQIHTILYDSEKTINLDSIIIENNLSNYFYLSLLIRDDDSLVNYKYSINFIKNINNQLINENNNIYKTILISKLIIELINNRQFEENDEENEEENDEDNDEEKDEENEEENDEDNDEEKDEEELKEIENNNKDKIKNNLNELQNLDLKLDENKIINNKIDKIYIDIIIKLIEKNKFDEILNELDLENINLTKTMFDELSDFIKINIEKYKISEQNDLFDAEKINFYFILFKILKNSIYIYQYIYQKKFKFLLELKKLIKKIIKFPVNNLNDDLKNKLYEIFYFIIDSKYYTKNNLNNTIQDSEIYTSTKNYSKTNHSGTNAQISLVNNSTRTATIQTQQSQNIINNNDNNYRVLKYEKIIHEQKDSINNIKEIKDELFIIGRYNNEIYIYEDKDKHSQIKILHLFDKEKQNIIKVNNNDIKVLDCSKQSFMIYNIVIDNNENINISGEKQINIPCSGCYEKKNGEKIEYVVIGEKGIYHFNDFPSIKIEKKIDYEKIINYKKDERNYKGSIKINDNILALTSNSVLPKGEDILVFYDMNKKEIIKDNKIQNFSFVNGVNGLIIMNLEKEDKKVLLCACKAYTTNQTNGILLINIEIKENKELTTKYYETGSFEVNCLCNIDVNENNHNYFFIGGLDIDKGEGMIKLCELIYKNNEFKIDILDDIFSDDEASVLFKSSINNIVQSKNSGKIIVSCMDGKVYSFSKPNINDYLEYDSEVEKELLNLYK